MRAPGFHDVVERVGTLAQRDGEAIHRREGGHERGEGRDPDRGRDHVIGGLRHVDVVVRVHRRRRATRRTEARVREVREHLVDVHVEGGARARLIDVDHELVAVRAAEDEVSGRDDRVGALRIEPPGATMHRRRRTLDAHDGVDDPRMRAEPADGEVRDGPCRLRPVPRVRRDLDRAERVVLHADARHQKLFVNNG